MIQLLLARTLSNSFRGAMAAALLFAATRAEAAVSAPLPKNANADEQFKKDCFEAENSLKQRAIVAQQRYDASLARRANRLAGLNAELSRQQVAISIPKVDPNNPVDDPETSSPVNTILAWGILAASVGFLIRYLWNRPERQQAPARPALGATVVVRRPFHALAEKAASMPEFTPALPKTFVPPQAAPVKSMAKAVPVWHLD